MRLVLVSTLALLLSLPAHAETKDPIFLLQNDESLLHISATESREVGQDLLIAHLQIEAEDRSINSVQNDINTLMANAINMAEDYIDVKAFTRSYNVHQYDRNRGRKGRAPDMIWKGHQSVTLKSVNAEELLELSGKIQDIGFIMRGLNYTLSNELTAEIQEELLEDALLKLSARAHRAAKALGKSTADLKEINATSNNLNNQPIYGRAKMSMEMSADNAIAAPVASPGETTIKMNVTAKALLR